jgi:hypothetical protein
MLDKLERRSGRETVAPSLPLAGRSLTSLPCRLRGWLRS